jgi:hypothetical protein
VTGGAEAGWIDVLTRTHLTPQANSALGFDLGTFGREAFTGGLGRWLGSRFSAVLTLRFDDGNTLTQVASAKNSQFFGKARLYLSRRHFIEASYGTSGTTNESRRTSPTALSPFTDTEDQRERRFQALYRGSVGLLRPQARYYTDRFEERDSFTLDAVPLVGGRADRRGAEAGVDLPVGRGRIRVGVEWVREELDSDSPLFLGADENVLADSTGFDDSRTRIAAFAGAEQTLDSLTVAAHVRGERFEAGRGTTVEPQLGLEARYGAGGGFTPFARVGRSARFPSFVETAALARAGGAPVVAPETLVEARGGSSWQRGEAAGELAAFVRRGSDLVLWLPPTGWRAATGDESARLGQVLPGDQEPGTEEPQPAFAELNRIDQRAIGADARLALRLPFNLSGEGFALVQSVEDEDGERLPYVPRAQALGRISYEKAFFPSRNLTLRGSIDSRVVGPRTTLSGGDLPAFAQMDAFLRARLIGFTAGLSVLNVFGQRVRTEESFPLPGRVVGFQIVWEFWD